MSSVDFSNGFREVVVASWEVLFSCDTLCAMLIHSESLFVTQSILLSRSELSARDRGGDSGSDQYLFIRLKFSPS